VLADEGIRHAGHKTLLPARRRHPKGHRPWIEDRPVLGRIIYVLRAGVPWRLFPREGRAVAAA
jgi:hypothetical protein